MIAQLDRDYIQTRPSKVIPRIISHFGFQGRFLTTNHRWLNSFILAGLRTITHIPSFTSIEKPIFIIGTGRSGSTISGKVLSMHKDIGFLNEPKALWYVIDPADDVNGHFTRQNAQYKFSSDLVTEQHKKSANRLFGHYLFGTRSKRVLDKNPEIIFRLSFVREIFPGAKFIFLIRNGWDTIHSITKWSQQNMKMVGHEQHDWWGVDRRKWKFMLEQLVSTDPLLSDNIAEICSIDRQEDMAAVEWVLTMQEGMRSLKMYKDCIHLLRYESLTTMPRKTLQDLCDFCELPEDKTFLNYAENVLSPNIAKPPISLGPAIESPFLKTMSLLDYSV